jgi:molybdenum cofactor cytidylyltransferase
MGTPKMLLPWGETTVLGQVIATLAQAGVGEIVVITGGARELVEAEAGRLARNFPLRCIHNPAHEKGEMLSSLQCGFSALGEQVGAALVALGDQPQISASAVLKVVASSTTSKARLIVPSYNMRRGHPWLVRRSLWMQILALTPEQTLRDFLSANAAEIEYVETDATILKDLDTPESYQREKP